MNKLLDSKIKQEYVITDLVTKVQGSILNSMKMISLEVLCNKGLRIIKKIGSLKRILGPVVGAAISILKP